MNRIAHTPRPGRRRLAARPLAPRRLATTMLALAAASGIAVGHPAPALATRPALVWGAYTRPTGTQTEQQAVQSLEAQIGRKLGVVRVFDLWDDAFPSGYDRWLRDTRRVPIYSVKAKTINGTVIPWSSIAGAKPGSPVYNRIVSWADRIKAYKGFMYLTFNHEPEAAASRANGTHTDFIAAWRKWVGIFHSRGVNNVEFMWIMTEHSFYQVPSTDPRTRRSGTPAMHGWTTSPPTRTTTTPAEATARRAPGSRSRSISKASVGSGCSTPRRGYGSPSGPAHRTRPTRLAGRRGWTRRRPCSTGPGMSSSGASPTSTRARPGTPCQWQLGIDDSINR